jgi:hypothetical protein
VVNPGATGVKYVLTRPGWWLTGNQIQPGQVIQVGGEGTTFGGSEWKTFAAKAQVIDTNAPVFWVREVTQAITLVAGVKAVTNIGIRDASASNLSANLKTTGGTTATTIMYTPTLVTAGVLNTATVTFAAQSAPGTNQTADTSTLRATIINW